MKSIPDFRFAQKEPSIDGSFDICYTYVFFVEFTDWRTGKFCRLKYVARAEKIAEVFAIKFYASRDRKSQYDKFSLAHKQLGIRAVYSIFDKCLRVIGLMLELYPKSSFIFKGAEAYDPQTHMWEDEYETQRFRIYRAYLGKRIGSMRFAHFHFPENSIYFLVNRADCEDVTLKKDQLMNMLTSRFGLV